MGDKETLLIKKELPDSVVKDTITSWNIACVSVPFAIADNSKDVATRDWPNEDGEDVYVPQTMKMAAYDMVIKLCYKGELSSSYERMTSFVSYLTGRDNSGAVFSVYSPHTNVGRKGCYFKSIDNIELWNLNGEDVVEFSITIRVTNPTEQVVLQKGN